MIPTEEEKQKIQEAQLANPDLPLGTAEQFLLTLASISALNPRLQLWAFKLNYEVLEKVSARLWFRLRFRLQLRRPADQLSPPAGDRGASFRPEAGHGAAGVQSDVQEDPRHAARHRQLPQQLQCEKDPRNIPVVPSFSQSHQCGSSLFQAKGFELSYLEKVVEVKDTVHRHSLLHHTCSLLEDNYPQSSDVYSEIPAITRSAKVRLTCPAVLSSPVHIHSHHSSL